jgi:hypothetical protein
MGLDPSPFDSVVRHFTYTLNAHISVKRQAEIIYEATYPDELSEITTFTADSMNLEAFMEIRRDLQRIQNIRSIKTIYRAIGTNKETVFQGFVNLFEQISTVSPISNFDHVEYRVVAGINLE